MLHLGYFPRSLHNACETFVELRELARLRQALRHQSPTGWGSRAATLDATGARLYNQVRSPTGSAVFNTLASCQQNLKHGSASCFVYR
jgi:hypothetical protein